MQPPLRAKEDGLLTASGKIFICRSIPSKFGNIQPPNTTSPFSVSSRSRYRHPFHCLIPGCSVLQTFSDSVGSDGRGLGLGQRQSEAGGCYFSSGPPYSQMQSLPWSPHETTWGQLSVDLSNMWPLGGFGKLLSNRIRLLIAKPCLLMWYPHQLPQPIQVCQGTQKHLNFYWTNSIK